MLLYLIVIEDCYGFGMFSSGAFISLLSFFFKNPIMNTLLMHLYSYSLFMSHITYIGYKEKGPQKVRAAGVIFTTSHTEC